MATKVNRKASAETASEAATSEAVTEDDEAAREAFDASTDAAADPFFATFTVEATLVQNADARERLGISGDTVAFEVTRHRKGVYVASYSAGDGTDPTIGKESRKPEVAVRNTIKALGLREAEFMFDAPAAESAQAPIPENAGDNQPDTWFFDEESEIADRLNVVAEHVREADKLMTGANRDAKRAWLGFGHAYNDAKAIFAEAGLAEEGENAKRGKAAWGVWLRTRFAGLENVEAVLASKNAAAQAGFFATAPEEVIDATGAGTASTFMRKAEEAAASFGSKVADTVLAQRRADENEDRTLSDADAKAAASDKLTALEAAYADAFAKWQADAAKAAEKGKTVQPFANAKDKGPLTLVRWMFDTAGDDFGSSKLGKAIAKAWETAVNAPSEQEKAEAETEKAAKTVAKRFADMSVDDAARHLLHMLVAHPEPEAVLDTLGDALVAWREDEAAKAEAAKVKAEAEASGEGKAA